METENDLQSQLHQVVEDLSPVQQAEVLDFALFLKERQLPGGGIQSPTSGRLR